MRATTSLRPSDCALKLESFAPTIPDWANDRHTLAGRKLGRGLDHFRKEGAKLVPPPKGDDPYVEEAYRLWAIKQGETEEEQT